MWSDRRTVTNRARLILNPSAGSDDAGAQADAINRRLRTRYESVEIVFTTAAGDASAAARRAVEDGCSHLFVGGGDGTLNEAVNGVASADGGLERVTIGLVPLGTGNDFAAALGIPTDIDPALDVLLAGHVRQVDLGSVNGRLFANISGGGFFAEVSESVTTEMKSVAGRLAYLVGGAQVLMDFTPVQASVRVDPGDLQLTTSVYAFAVCNAQLFGGGKLIAPHAVLDDGLLDLCIIEAMPTLAFVALLREVARGTHVDDPRVRYVRGARIDLTFDQTVNINTDGEVLEVSSCEYRVLPHAARFFAAQAS